jgi:Ca-activated chloride channel family protein
MKIHNRLFLIGLIWLMALVPLQSAYAQNGGTHIRITQEDNSKFPQVTVYVSVTDASGEPLGANPNQIQISENGQVMKPEQISGSGDIGPLTTLLVMDVSGSMNNAGKLSAARAAAQAYIDQLRPGDKAGLITFNTKVTYLQTITGDHAALIQAIQNLKAKDDTAMFDALDQAIQILQDVSGRKAIIVLTDGLDNQSKHTADEINQAIGASGLSISTIGLGAPGQGPYFGLDETALKSLAEKNGGIYSYANNSDDLRSLFQLYGRALQSEYRITYRSPLTLRDGVGRTLTVSLGSTASAQVKYNPGGVLPEVGNQASWTIFVFVLAGLVILIFAPGVFTHLLARKTAKVNLSVPDMQKPRVKLK